MSCWVKVSRGLADDYINANYVNVPDADRKYILTQGSRETSQLSGSTTKQLPPPLVIGRTTQKIYFISGLLEDRIHGIHIFVSKYLQIILNIQNYYILLCQGPFTISFNLGPLEETVDHFWLMCHQVEKCKKSY